VTTLNDSEPEVLATEAPIGPSRPDSVASPRVRRFQVVALGAVLAAAVPYLWVLWDLWTGTVDPLRTDESRTAAESVIYDVQARAMMHGHLSLPNGSIGYEAFIHDGRTYTYFGIFPSLLRMPILLVTHSLDGRLTAMSMLTAWVVTALVSALLLWRIRIVVRGDAALGWAETVSYGMLLFSILAGSVLVPLASMPDVYAEDEMWGVALACASLFALLGVVERPSWGRVTACGLFVLLANLNRGTTGYACVLGTMLVAAWFAIGRGGPDRRRWAFPVLLAGLVALVVGCAIDFAKFDVLFGFPASEQLLYKLYGFSHINGGRHFSIHFLPSTVQTYLWPGNLRITPDFPFLTFPGVPTHLIAHTQLFNRGNSASIPASMPLLFGAGLWGVIITFGPHRPVIVRSIRILLVAAAASAGAMLIYGTVYERFLADFMPLLVLASTVGVVDIFRRLDGRPRPARILVPATIGVLALFGFVANMGIAITPQKSWTQTQGDHFVQAEHAISDVTGHPLSHDVVQGSFLPAKAPIGQLFIVGNCRGLYISDGEGSAFPFPALIWRPVELAPHVPLCRSLIGAATSTSPRTGVHDPDPPREQSR
jgi:hypothetical protein